MHVYAAPTLYAEHTYESLVRTFEAFGVPTEVLIDNQRAAVVKRENGRVVFNPLAVYGERFETRGAMRR